MSSPFFWTVPILAFGLDLLIGDPEFSWHPIRLMGRAITWLEPRARRLPVPEFLAGLLLTTSLVFGAWGIVWLVLSLAGWIHPAARWGLEILLAYFFLACRDLDVSAMRVHESLVAGDLPAARQRLSRIVGRETDHLDESAVARAATETVAENLVDGVLSPLFYLVLGGVPGMAAYKMINTLDSMIGYKSPAYLRFGKAAARLDDAANFLPARLSVPLVALAAETLFRKGRESLALARSDGRRHASPNSGFPEAAFAGALGVTFGGPNVYHGEVVHKPFIGEGLGEASPDHIPAARRLMWTASALGLILSVFVLSFTASPALAGDALAVTQGRKSVTLSGFTRATTTMTLATEVSGKILSLGYDVGQTIGKTPHALIDTTFVDFQIQSIRQSIRKTELAQQRNASRVAYLKREFERMEHLHQGDRATEVRRDAAEEEYRQAKLEGDSLELEKAALDISLKEAEERKRRHRITAPEGWVLVNKRAEAGEVVTVNTPLATVADFGHLVVPLSVSAEELDAIRALGDTFEARLETAPATLRLKWVNPEFDEKTRKLAIELAVVRHGGENRGGLRLTLPLEIAAEGLRVPVTAVIHRYENPRVTLKDGGEVIPIQILGTSDGHVLIADHPRLSVGTELLPASSEGGGAP